MVGAVGVVALAALVIGVGANVARRRRRHPPSPLAQATARRDADRRPRPRPATPLPTVTRLARRRCPTADPVPTPVLVPAPLTGRLVTPAVAARHPIAVMIDDLGAARPQSGLSSASVVWQAPAEGGIPRYMAIFQDDAAQGRRAGPQLALLLHRLGRRVAGDLRPRRRLARRRSRRSGRRATASTSTTSTSSATAARSSGSRPRRPPHNLYTTGHEAARDRQARRRQGQGLQAGLEVRAGRAARGAAVRRHDHRHATRTTRSSYTYDRTTNTYLRSVTGEKKQTDARDGDRIAPKNVVVMRMHFGPLNDGHPGAPRSRPTVVGSGQGLDLDQRPDDQGHLEEDRDDQADPVLRRERQARSR